MRAKSIIRLAAVCAATCLAGLAVFASEALGTATQTGASGFAFPVGIGPGAKVSGDCSALSGAAGLVLVWSSGNGHFYGPTSNPLTSGLNVEGPADLWSTDGNGKLLAMLDSGTAHLWLGNNTNKNNTGDPTGNQQTYFGITISFQGTWVAFNSSGGGGSSASGNPTGWGQTSVRCS